MTDVRGARPGRRVVLAVYAAVVALAAVFGAILGVVLPAREGFTAVARLGPLVFEITPLSFALYGATSVAVVLGVLLLAVEYVSNRYDDAG